jgi:site-specific DNA recombinase
VSKNASPFPEHARLVAYCRDSGGREQDVSVDRQRAELTAWALDAHVTITHWFEDRARSGGSTLRRDAFLELTDYLSEADRPEVGVVIWEYARFARQFDDAMFYVASLRRLGYQVYSITDAIPDTLEGRLLESILAWKNAKYREDLSRAVRSGLSFIVAAHQGYPNINPPLGFLKEYHEIGQRRDGTPHRTARLIPDPALSPLIQTAFAMRAAGATYREIHQALHLTEHAISLRNILRNPIYNGTLKFGGNEYPGFVPPLVSPETFQRAQTINALRAAGAGIHHPRRSRSRYLLTGLITCAHCGGRMDGHTGTRPSRPGQPEQLYYICYASQIDKAACPARLIPKAQVEQLVLAKVDAHLQRPDVFQAILKRHKKMKPRARRPAQLERAQQELADTENEIRRLVAAIRDSGHSRALLDELKTLEKERERLTLKVNDLDSRIVTPGDISPEDLAHALQLLSAKLHSEDPAEVITVLRGLVAEVCVRREGDARLRSGSLTGEITLILPVLGESVNLSLES